VPIHSLGAYAVNLAKVIFLLIYITFSFNIICRFYFFKEYKEVTCFDQFYNCQAYIGICQNGIINGQPLKNLCQRTCGVCTG